MNMLLCTDGSPHTAQALKLGMRVARAAAKSVDILVVAEQGAEPDREEEMHRFVEAAVADLKAAGIPVTVHRRTGRIAEEVVDQAQRAPYDLLIIGSRGRQGVTRLLLGSMALRVTEQAPASIMVVKGRTRELRRFLVCSSAGPVSKYTVQFASRLAGFVGASVTLLHVMSQLPLTEDAILNDLDASAGELIRRDSREGRHLREMLDLLAEQGHQARAVVRHGLVVDEVIAEGREGRYDLLVVGAHVTPGLDARLVDDLSGDIMLAAKRPVMVVHSPQDGPETSATQG